MDRYQFEDLISDYLENTLSLSQRKTFEAYVENHPEAQKLLEDMKANLNKMHQLPKVQTSPAFMKNLQGRLSAERRMNKHPQANTFFGFSPMYATLMSGLVIALLFVSFELFNSKEPQLPVLNRSYATQKTPNTSSMPKIESKLSEENSLNMAEADSSFQDEDDKKTKKDFSKQIRLVNDK